MPQLGEHCVQPCLEFGGQQWTNFLKTGNDNYIKYDEMKKRGPVLGSFQEI